ncbi:MAG: CPBP family intramembrane glutamic endopeptidase [archaeon]
MDLLLIFVPIITLLYYKKNAVKVFFELGFKKIPLKDLIVKGFFILVLMFVVSFALNILFFIIGYNDLALVTETITSFPIIIIVYLFTFKILAEEIFFRGFLVKRIGIIASSVIFGSMHLFYGSIVEVVGATILGIILAYHFKKYNSIYPVLLAHFLYNLTGYVFAIMM